MEEDVQIDNVNEDLANVVAMAKDHRIIEV
jgi:hypothetical protein